MNPRVLAGALAFLFVARPARAQSNGDGDATRVRLGVSVVSGIVEVPYASLETDPTTAGVAGRFGVQLGDRFAIFDQVNFTVFWLQLRDAIFFEWTPVDFFSVAAGPTIEWLADIAGSADSDWSIGGSVRLALHAIFSRGACGRRRAMTFSLEASPSYAFAGWNTYSTSGFQLGVLGGVGLDWY